MTLLLADFASVMTKIGYVLLALLALVVMVLIHEAGHYTAGKILKFKINEFGIGFGPPFVKVKRKNGELFTIRPIPLGGFCAFEGEDQDRDQSVEGAFNNQKPWKRIIVLLAGVTFNFLSAIIILSITFGSYGYALPKVVEARSDCVEGYEQTFMKDDVIIELNGKNVYSMASYNISSILADVEGDETTALVYRNGKRVEIKVNIGTFKQTDEEGNVSTYRGLGIQSQSTLFRLNFFECIGYSFVFIFQLMVMTFQTIGSIFTGAISVAGNIGGPITTIKTMSDTIQASGFYGVMMIFGIVSSSLAIMNALPIPALDGSRVIFTIIEWIRKKPIKRKTEAIIHTVGLIILFGLTIVFDIINVVGMFKLG